MSSTSQITDKLLLFVQKLPGRLSVYTLEATNSNFHETSDYNDYVIQEHGTTSIFDKMYKKTENKLLGLGDFFGKVVNLFRFLLSLTVTHYEKKNFGNNRLLKQ